MKKAPLIILVFALIVSCRTSLNPISGKKSYTKKQQLSKIVNIKTTANTRSTNSVIKGVVLDGKTREPIPYANVELINRLSRFGLITDTLGNFQFDSCPSGIYKISVRYIGFTDLNDSIDVTRSENKNIEIELGYLNPRGIIE